ncbi:hypothetical protein OIE68_02655 [Nocardia vinacea]|nr:hypothetical protein OIE68_02655 [Nocardia vinacea]
MPKSQGGPARSHRSSKMRADEPASVIVRGTVADLLRFVYHRRALGTLEISGNRDLLDLWRERTGFWLTEDGS